MAQKGVLDWLKEANNTLEQVPNGILIYFDAITQLGERATQSFVDGVCRYAAWMVNITVERIRQKVLKGLYDQNSLVRKVINVINVGKQVIQDPLGAIGSFFGTVTSPITTAIKFTVELVQELAKLAANVTRIASALPPPPPNPHINYNEFKLKLGVFSMGALSSADSLPDPEVLFPKPENPFGPLAFKKSFEEGATAFNDGETTKKIKYTPKSSSTQISQDGTVA